MSTRKHILVFGATGEIGGRIARQCVDAGHAVTGVTRGVNTQPHPDMAGIEPVVADKGDPGCYTEALAGREFDVVIEVSTVHHGQLGDGVVPVVLDIEPDANDLTICGPDLRLLHLEVIEIEFVNGTEVDAVVDDVDIDGEDNIGVSMPTSMDATAPAAVSLSASMWTADEGHWCSPCYQAD